MQLKRLLLFPHTDTVNAINVIDLSSNKKVAKKRLAKRGGSNYESYSLAKIILNHLM